MQFHRLRVALLVLLTAAPLAAAPAAAPHPWCATGEGAELIALARHEEFQRRLDRERREGGLATKSAPVLYQEGHVAILDDDGSVTRPRRPFDLAGRSLEFLRRPRGMSAKRSKLDFKALIGDRLPLGNNDAEQVVFPAGFRFPFGDRTYRSVWVNSNGNLTFGGADPFAFPDLASLVFGPPRIAPLLADLDPSFTTSSRGVFVAFLPGRVRITWLEVPETRTNTKNTFQVTLFANGRVAVVYGEVDVQAAIVGVAPYGELDLTLLDLDVELPFPARRTAIAERFTAAPEVDDFGAAQLFAEHFADIYTTVFLWLDFPAITPGFAYEITLRQDVQGIGEGPFDFGFVVPASDNLVSLVQMGDLSRYPDDPDETFFNDTASTMAIVGHEFGHIWLAKARYRDADGAVSRAHLAGPHWSYYMDAEGSLMHGNDWDDNGDGTFTATAGVHRRYSPLDRYLMGLAPAGTVPATYYIAGTNELRFSLPTVGTTISGDRVEVSVDDIIAAEGPRRPPFATSPKSFRTAFVVVGLAGQGVSPASIAKIERYRERWTRYFQEATDSRGEVKTAIFPR